MTDHYLTRIGRLIRDARQHRGWTQAQLAEALSTSQSAVNRIERGNQNISLEMIARIGVALLFSSLLNARRTSLLFPARMVFLSRSLEVLGSIGVRARWINDGNDL